MSRDQLHLAIQEAKALVAREGIDNADIRYVTLAGFGYLADQMATSDRGVIHIKLDGKRFFAFGLFIGGVIVGIAQTLLKGF